MHFAAFYGQFETCLVLLKYGAFIVLDSSQIDLFFDNRIDITDQVIFELNDLYKSDSKYLEFIIGKWLGEFYEYWDL